MRTLVLLLVSFAAVAANRYVSPTGTNSVDCTNILSPCATLEYAENLSSGGDVIYLRGGRYTTTDAVFLTPSVAATASARLTIRAYQGEHVVFDCENVSGRRFVNFTVAGIGYYTFANFSIANVHSSVGPFLIQGTHQGIEIKGVRASGAGFGITMNPFASTDGGLRILGSYIENGLSTGFDCSSQSGSNNGDYTGCNNVIIQDTVFSRTVGSGSDHVGMEAGSNILFSRVSVKTPTVANDCFDIKANNVVLEDVSVIGCTAKGATVWGYSKYRNVKTDGHSPIIGEYASRDVDGAVDDGGFIKITATYSPWGGQVPIPGHRVTISGVVGCTGANGTWIIKDAVSKDVFRIMGADGSGTSCGGTFSYDAAASVKLAPPLGGGYAADLRYTTFYLQGGGSAIEMVYNMTEALPWALHDSIAAALATSGSIGICASAIGPVRTSNRNQYYTGRGQAYATAFSGGGTCTSYDGNSLSTNEPASHYGHPNLDATTLRATATSPVTLVNRGYYSGWNSVASGETRQIVRWRAPAATDSCTVNLYSDSGFTNLVESINSPAGASWRDVVFGVTTPLSPATTYYHWISCGYDAMSGSGTTLSSLSGTTSVFRTLGPPQSVLQQKAALDYSVDNTSWTLGTPVSCSAGCTLTVTGLERGQVYYFRTRLLASDDSTLVTSFAKAEVVQ